jgi:hypothetical protein
MQFKLIRSYDNYISANLQLQQLEAEGIRSYLQDENTVTLAPQFSNAIGGIKLMVDLIQYEEALKILDGLDEAYRKTVACPKCGANSIERELKMNTPVNWVTSILTWMFGSYAVAPEQQYRCGPCGHVMKQLPETNHSLNEE